MAKKFYVDSKQLEADWTQWLKNKDSAAWDRLLDGVYKICHGVAIHFHPANEDEHNELAHEAFILTVGKINDGRLTFTPGRAPVFNLLTTTVFRHLYSKMNKDSRRRAMLANLKHKITSEQEVQ